MRKKCFLKIARIMTWGKPKNDSSSTCPFNANPIDFNFLYIFPRKIFCMIKTMTATRMNTTTSITRSTVKKSVRWYCSIIFLLLVPMVSTVCSWSMIASSKLPSPLISQTRSLFSLFAQKSSSSFDLSHHHHHRICSHHSNSIINNNKYNNYYYKSQQLISLSTSSSSIESIDDTVIENEILKNIQDYNYEPIIDFTTNISYAIDTIERLDDAIMGGISTSSVRPYVDVDLTNTNTNNNNETISYARWSGVCRTDGGGFCGFRTNPFIEPLMIPTTATSTTESREGQDEQQPPIIIEGFYVKCRLASDNEPERRIWKFTTRTKPDRGELLYQAPFNFAQSIIQQQQHDNNDNNNNNNNEWYTVLVPFTSFKQVRGPRIISDGPQLNVSGGIYQLGMTMSKFVFNTTTTELINFRDGYFDVHINQIGLYYSNNPTKTILETTTLPTTSTSTTKISNDTDTAATNTVIQQVKIFTKNDAKKQQSVTLKTIRPISKLFFSETSNRRKSAYKKIQMKYNKTNRIQVIVFGWKCRIQSIGYIRALVQTVAILSIDTFRTILLTILRLTLVYPVQTVLKLVRIIQRKPKVKQE